MGEEKKKIDLEEHFEIALGMVLCDSHNAKMAKKHLTESVANIDVLMRELMKRYTPQEVREWGEENWPGLLEI